MIKLLLWHSGFGPVLLMCLCSAPSVQNPFHDVQMNGFLESCKITVYQPQLNVPFKSPSQLISQQKLSESNQIRLAAKI